MRTTCFIFGLSLAVLGSAFSSACSSTTNNEDGKRISSPAKQTVALKLVVEADNSASIEVTRTPRITMPQLDKIIDLVREHSGELAFGFIDNSSNKPFIRLRIDPRPAPPPKPHEKNNPFDQEKALTDYNRKMREFKALDQKWETETSQRVATFKALVQPLIDCLHNKQCRSKATDVLGGIRRADLYLAEKEAVNSLLRLMLLITDGLETVKPKAVPPVLQSKAKIIVVNGSASLGILKNYDVEAVEGIDAGIRRIGALLAAEQTQTSSAASGNEEARR